MRTATIQVRIERSLEEAAGHLLPAMIGHLGGSVAVLPSSLDGLDIVAERVVDALPREAQASVVTPVAGNEARKAFVLPTGLGNWRHVPVHVAGAALETAILPGGLVDARHRIIAVDVVEVARQGPFVLDVAARYAHPRQRVRFVTDRARSDLTAEVASVVPLSLVVVALVLPEGTLLAATTDPIAAELIALALSERCIGGIRAFTGPWEDPVVQRATELDLGVLLPAAIRLIVTGNVAREAWADALAEHVRRRLGLPLLPA